MELGAEQLIGWVANLVLIASAFYVLIWPNYRDPGHQFYRQKPSGQADSSGLSDGDDTKRSMLSKIRHYFSFKVCLFTLLVATAQSALPFMIENFDPRMPNEGAPDKSSVVSGSDTTVSLTEPLLKALGYELEGQLKLALAAYREAYDHKAVTQEARAFILNRIARFRSQEGYPEEAMEDARFAISLGGSKSLYLHTLARILIDQCLLDEAEQRLSQIQGDNAITADLRMEIVDNRGNCPVH